MGISSKKMIAEAAKAIAVPATLLVSQLALGQVTATPTVSAAAPENELQEVIVTAQKRPESAQTTPIAMTVYGADEITRKGIVDIQSLTTNDTSLNFTMGAGGAEPYLTMRGISSHDTTEIGDPAVPIATDGFFMNRPYGLLASLYDIEQIEVLRGPQGTLYGRNAVAGLVNIIAAKPTMDFEAQGSVETGNYNTLNTTAVLNLPFSDSVQLRAAYDSEKHDGYRTVYTEPGAESYRGDDADSESARVELAIEPIDHLRGLLTLQATQIGGTGNVENLIPFVPNPNVPGDILHTIPALGSATTWTNYSPTWQNIDDKVYKLQLDYDDLPGGAKLVYLGGYDNTQWHHALPLNGAFGEPFTTPQDFIQNEYPKTVNQELRIVSPAGGIFAWQAGVFYFQERSTNLNSYAELNPGAENARELIAFEFPLVEDNSKAAYGQGSVKLTDDLQLSAGLRYTRDDKERTGVLNEPVADTNGVSQAGSTESSKTTYHVGLDWTATSHSFEYAKVDTGYKAGGFSTCSSTSAPSYAPETVTAFEVGSKNRMADNTIQMNVSLFLDNYKNEQISIFVPPSVCVADSEVENAGGSRIYGLEGELDALVDPVGTFNLNFTYLHARFTDFIAAPGVAAAVADCTPAAGGNCQLAGNTLSNSPTWTIAAGLEHTWTLPNSMGLNGRIEDRYQSKQFFDPFNYASTTEQGYSLANAYLDLTGGTSRAKWKVGAWIRNLANKVYFNNMEEFYTNNTYVYGYGAPRTFGVRIQVDVR
jgi:iron complex outermembrane recepter protein